MDTNNKIINLNEYRQMRKDKKIDRFNKNDRLKKEDDDRRNTFNLFMRVLATMRKES